eukprot:3148619-Pleurochrysis_carterae.AAC.1
MQTAGRPRRGLEQVPPADGFGMPLSVSLRNPWCCTTIGMLRGFRYSGKAAVYLPLRTRYFDPMLKMQITEF